MNALHFLKKPFSASVGATATQVLGGHGQLYGYHIVNNTAALAYVQVFDLPAASVTVGTTVPDYVIPLPANGQAVMPMSRTGIDHANGLTVACTTARGNAVAATCDVVMWVSK